MGHSVEPPDVARETLAKQITLAVLKKAGADNITIYNAVLAAIPAQAQCGVQTEHDYFEVAGRMGAALIAILETCDEAPTDNNAWVVAIQKIAGSALSSADSRGGK